MAKRRGQPVHGWVNLDKSRGISSATAVAIVRRVFAAAKAGVVMNLVVDERSKASACVLTNTQVAAVVVV